MAVSKRVATALDSMIKVDAEQALHDICSAIEVTANAEAGRGGRRTYKDFVRDNFALISRTAFGVEGTIGRLRIAYNHPELPVAADGLCGIEDIVYHVVRCGLYHAASIPSNLQFVAENVIKCDGGSTLVLPASIVNGLIAAVVTSPSNRGESIHPRYQLQFDFVTVAVNKLWGKRTELNQLFEAMISVREAMKAIDR